MYHKTYLVAAIVLILLLAGNPGLSACESGYFIGDFPDEALRLFQHEPGTTELYGQIIAISSQAVCLENGGVSRWFQFSHNIQIWCNGLPAVWAALRPVTRRAFFEAVVVMNKHGEVIVISGFYNGEVCVLQSWRYTKDLLQLQLRLPDSGETCWKTVIDGALLPEGNWLQEEIEIFVLYNRYHNIRAVYLPD